VFDLQALLKYAVELRASDVHFKAGSAPRIRIDGEMRITPFGVLSASDTEDLVTLMVPAERVEEFRRTNEADFSVSLAGLGRFRGNAFRQRGSAGIVLRRCLPSAASCEALGLPLAVSRLAEEPRGLVLVTGPTGSGKTTTLAAMIDHINSTRAVNIVTLEDPIEVLHADKLAIINQREIGVDTNDYAQALRRCLRQDPDVIFIGEMRDAETVWAAVSAAETGHLVLSTLHTSSASETINRIIDLFPPTQQRQARLALGANLRGVVSQRLIPRSDRIGRIASIEIMIVNGRIAERIVNPEAGRGETIDDIMADGSYYGMQTFDQSLLALYREGQIALSEALLAATNPHDLRVAMQNAGVT
jgi:twitching motility protein PilT